MSMTTHTTSTPPVAGRHPRRAITLAAMAVTAPMLVWLIAVPAGRVDLRVRQGSDLIAVGPLAIVVVALLVSAATLGFAAMLSHGGRGTPARRTVFLVVTGALFVVSLLGPLGAATLSAGVVLAAMHVAVAGVLIPGCALRLAASAAGSRHDG